MCDKKEMLTAHKPIHYVLLEALLTNDSTQNWEEMLGPLPHVAIVTDVAWQLCKLITAPIKTTWLRLRDFLS